MDLIIMFIFRNDSRRQVIGASGEDTKPKTKDEWRELD